MKSIKGKWKHILEFVSIEFFDSTFIYSNNALERKMTGDYQVDFYDDSQKKTSGENILLGSIYYRNIKGTINDEEFVWPDIVENIFYLNKYDDNTLIIKRSNEEDKSDYCLCDGRFDRIKE